MTRTPQILTLAALATLAACDTPDAAQARTRDEILRTDAESLVALAESESEIQDAMAAQLDVSSEHLLDIALDPAASPEVVLTAPPSPSLASSCVGLNDFLDFCYETTNSGVWVWIEVLGVASPKDYLGTNGACDNGGLDVGLASVSYGYCYWNVIPIEQVYIGGEACWFGDCEDFFYAKLL